MNGAVDDAPAVYDLGAMLPEDLTGRTVLDVGCRSGALAREAARRGAARVVAVDIDDLHLDLARSLNTWPDHRAIDYRRADLEVALPPGPYDHVVCHNLLHRTRNPIDAIDRLVAQASSSLILEVSGPGCERPARLLRRDYDATPGLRARMAAMPLVVVGRDGTPHRKREQKFYFSAEAIHNLLMEQRRYFATLDIEQVGADGRFLARATRRNVEHLVVISGPTGAGKTTLLERLQTVGPLKSDPGPVPELASVTGLGSVADYEVTNGDGLRHLDQTRSELLFHYDLLRPWRRDAAVHQRDEGLHVFDCSRRIEVIVLVATVEVLRARLAAELNGLADPDSRQGHRLREVLALYGQPDRLIDRVDAWLDFCRSKGATPRFIDSSDGYRPIADSAWPSTIRRSDKP